jgi:hypothetical protein
LKILLEDFTFARCLFFACRCRIDLRLQHFVVVVWRRLMRRIPANQNRPSARHAMDHHRRAVHSQRPQFHVRSMICIRVLFFNTLSSYSSINPTLHLCNVSAGAEQHVAMHLGDGFGIWSMRISADGSQVQFLLPFL